jgi:DNA-binding MarR family transcriptional regulator
MSSNPRTNSQQPSDALARKLKRYSTPAQSVLDSGAGDRAGAHEWGEQENNRLSLPVACPNRLQMLNRCFQLFSELQWNFISFRSYGGILTGLLRLLPRLPALLMLQAVVNGLVDYAADAMTTQGRRPRLVRWTWQRDVTHRFQYREQRMHFFTDGVLALCIRTQQGENNRLDQWYGLFLLTTELDDERLMRLRLERLLCWRESPERWSSYQHMMPVLILARSQRQGDHWQHAVEATALKLHLDPLAGALACLPPLESAHVNPWLLNVRTLATDESYHLQDLLKPLQPAAFPPSLWLEESEEEERDAPLPSNASIATLSSGAPSRPGRFIVGDLANRAAHVAQEDLGDQEVIALLGLRLTPCQWNILRLLLEHPLHSDEELADFLGIQRKSVRCSLYELHQLGCLEPIATEVGKRWHLCVRGLRLIAAANHMHICNIATLSDDGAERETLKVIQRGEAWLSQRIQHTAGIYGFFARLAQAARREPGQELCWWETGAVCERRYRVGEQWYNLKPEALALFVRVSRPWVGRDASCGESIEAFRERIR